MRFFFLTTSVFFFARRLSFVSCGALAPSCGASRTAASLKLCCGRGRACARNNWSPNRSSHTYYSCMYFILTCHTERCNRLTVFLHYYCSLCVFYLDLETILKTSFYNTCVGNHNVGHIIAVQGDTLLAASTGCFSEV